MGPTSRKELWTAPGARRYGLAMGIRGWGALALSTLVLAGCSVAEPDPSPEPTTTAVPADIEDFFDAAVAGDVAGVQEHLAVYNEAAGRNLTASEISTDCAADEATAVAAKVSNPSLTAYVYTGTEPWIVRFESSDGANEGWGIEMGDDGWYWQAQAASCRALWRSPSPSPS